MKFSIYRKAENGNYVFGWLIKEGSNVVAKSATTYTRRDDAKRGLVRLVNNMKTMVECFDDDTPPKKMVESFI